MKSEIINIRPDARVKSNGCSGTLEREEWRPVKGYEGLYEVSSFGRVRSVDRNVRYVNGNIHHRKGKFLSQYIRPDGYVQIEISKDNNKRQVTAHRLVAEAFIPNPDNLPQVNHRNEDKTANYPDNMEWCNSKYNNNFGTKPQRISKKLSGRNHTNVSILKMRETKRSKMKPVLQYTLDGEFVAEYESQRAAQRQTGTNESHIGRCCRGECNYAGGFIWRYKD